MRQKVSGMTTNRHHSPDDHDDSDRPALDPLRPDQLLCSCGATADRTGSCRKCRARARWDRRTAGRRTHADRPPTRRPGPLSTSSRSGTRRAGC
jgi:hypothetical protein